LLKEQGFVFTENGRFAGGPVRTLKEFVFGLATLPSSVLSGHARRGDFSRWIADVFRDHFLASDIRKVEQRFRLGHIKDLSDSLVKLIQERYEVSPEPITSSQTPPAYPAFDADLLRSAPVVN
jgi:hypothetical protein